MKKFAAIFLLLFMSSSSSAFAQSDTDIRVETDGNFDSDDSTSIEVREESGFNGSIETREEKLNVKGNGFEISGKVTDVSDNSFVISGNEIFVDTILRKTTQDSIRVGQTVRVEGLIVNNKMFAEDVMILRGNQFVEISNLFNRIISFLKFR